MRVLTIFDSAELQARKIKNHVLAWTKE